MYVLYTGEVFDSPQGQVEVIHKVNTNQKYKIRFIDSGYECTSYEVTIRKGATLDVTRPHPNKYYGIGFVGEGCYGTLKDRKATSVWSDMLRRCYKQDHRDTRHSAENRYRTMGVSVCEEWHNMQNFVKWFYQQKRCRGWHLDKDLTKAGSRVYSPETCTFVPKEINTLLISCNARRGSLPVGVSTQDGEWYRVVVSAGPRKGLTYKGGFSNPLDAFEWYKTHKMEVVCEIAEKHWRLGNINETVYNNLINWEIKPYPE